MSELIISKNPIPILRYGLENLKVGDYIWMDWDNIPKPSSKDMIRCPDNFSLPMCKFADTCPRRILHVSIEVSGTYGNMLKLILTDINRGWVYEKKHHLPWMYYLPDLHQM